MHRCCAAAVCPVERSARRVLSAAALVCEAAHVLWHVNSLYAAAAIALTVCPTVCVYACVREGAGKMHAVRTLWAALRTRPPLRRSVCASSQSARVHACVCACVCVCFHVYMLDVLRGSSVERNVL